jgi:hypothetical protein
VAVDYEADLALVAGQEAAFMAGLQAMTLSPGALPGDRLDVLQVQPGGRVIASSAAVTTVELATYPYGYQFLAYRLSGSLQNRHGHLSLPVVRGRRLAGLLKRDDSQNQTLEVTPVELIAHFLEDMDDGRYAGFPVSGIHFVPTQDPELRRYLGLPLEGGGVFVDNVVAHSAAERAGIQVGDVILAIDGRAVDNRGFYQDGRLGRIGITHLIRCGYQVNDRPALTLVRQGRPLTAVLTLDHLAAGQYLVAPYQHDRPPEYYVLGGLVLQELSAPYLMDFGNDWMLTAPIHLIYLHHNQFELKRPAGEKIVILNSVLPNSATIGYESLNNAVIEQINGRPIHRLADVPRAWKIPGVVFTASGSISRPLRSILMRPGSPMSMPRCANDTTCRHCIASRAEPGSNETGSAPSNPAPRSPGIGFRYREPPGHPPSCPAVRRSGGRSRRVAERSARGRPAVSSPAGHGWWYRG